MSPLPTHTRAVVLNRYALDGWQIGEVPLPALGERDVLVKISAAPINPSDLSFLQGYYGIRKTLPVVPGFEGGGRVIAAGSALDQQEWMGRRVACFAGSGHGTYAEYMVVPATNCFPVDEHITDEYACMLIVNPITVWALIDLAIDSGTKAVIQTAAASALGHALCVMAGRRGLKVINVVRRAALVDQLKAQGADYALDSSADGFDVELRELARKLDARLAFDAVGGTMTDRVLRAMPNGARIIVYGGLDGTPSQVGVDQLIFRDKHVDGFWLSTWMPKHLDKVAAAWSDVLAHAFEFRPHVRDLLKLEEFGKAIDLYQSNMSGGKVLITP